MREIERKKGSGGTVVIDTTFKWGGNGDKFTAIKVPRQCPFVFPANIG
jgi:hypothetical protein